MFTPVQMVRNSLFANTPSWFYEEINSDSIQFGDKAGQWFRLTYLGQFYVIIDAYKMDCPPEILDTIASVFSDYYRSQKQDVLLSCRGLHASGSQSQIAKEMSIVLNQGLRKEMWSIRLPLYSWIPIINTNTKMLMLDDDRNVFEEILTVDRTHSFVAEEQQDHQAMKDGERSLGEWITSLCPNVVFRQSSSYDDGCFYYVPDGFIVKFLFQKKRKGSDVSFESSFYLENDHFKFSSRNLNDVITHTTQKVIEHITKMGHIS